MIIRIATSVLLGSAGLAKAAEDHILQDRQGRLGNVVPQLANDLGLAPSPATSTTTGQRVGALTAGSLPSVTDDDLAPPATTTTTTRAGSSSGGAGILPIGNLPSLNLPSLALCPLTAGLDILTCLDQLGQIKTLFPTRQQQTTTQAFVTTSAPQDPDPEPTTTARTTKAPSLPDCLEFPLLNNIVSCLTNGIPTVLFPPTTTTTTTRRPSPNPGPVPQNPSPSPTLPDCPFLNFNPSLTTLTCLENGTPTAIPPLGPILPPGPSQTTVQPTTQPNNPGAGNPPTGPTTTPAPAIPACPILIGIPINQPITCQNNGVVTTIDPLIPAPAPPTTQNPGAPSGNPPAGNPPGNPPAASTTGAGGSPAGPPPSNLPQCPDSLLGGLENPVGAVTCLVGTVTSIIGGATSAIGGVTSVVGGITSDVGSIIAPTTALPGNSTSNTLAPWVPIIVSNVLSGTLAPLPAPTQAITGDANATLSAPTGVPAAGQGTGSPTVQPTGGSTTAGSVGATGVTGTNSTGSTTSVAGIGAVGSGSTPSSTPPALFPTDTATNSASPTPSPTGDSTSDNTTSTTSSSPSATTTSSNDQEQAMMNVAEYICRIFGCGGAAASGKDSTISITTTAPASGSTTTLETIITTTADPPPAQTQTVTLTDQPVQTRPVDSAPLGGFFGAGTQLAPPLFASCLSAAGAALFAVLFHHGIFA